MTVRKRKLCSFGQNRAGKLKLSVFFRETVKGVDVESSVHAADTV